MVPALANSPPQGVAGRTISGCGTGPSAPSRKRGLSGGLLETRTGDATGVQAGAPGHAASAARRTAPSSQCEVRPAAALIVARYHRQSCPYDSTLVVWETVQRWLTCSGLAQLPYPAPESRWFNVGPSQESPVWVARTMDLATPLRDWLRVREALSRMTTAEMRYAAHSRLGAIRDALRSADAPQLVPTWIRTVDALDAQLRQVVTDSGVADAVLRRLFHPATASPRFCRVDRKARPCAHGVRSTLRHDCMCSLTNVDVIRAQHSPWAAFASRVTGAVQAGTATLPHCDHCGCADISRGRVPVANCGPETPADLVALCLPWNRRPDRAVDLDSAAWHHLPTHNAAYRLVAALMFTREVGGGHYVAVVRAPARPWGWICYDANANCGVGWSVPPPTGFDRLDPRLAPTDPAAPGYWPMVLLYVRIPRPPPA